MPRYNDNSPHADRWTNAHLMREARRLANFENFGSFFRDEPVTFGNQKESADFIKAETRLYRETWLNPILDEIEKRFLRSSKSAT